MRVADSKEGSNAEMYLLGTPLPFIPITRHEQTDALPFVTLARR